MWLHPFERPRTSQLQLAAHFFHVLLNNRHQSLVADFILYYNRISEGWTTECRSVVLLHWPPHWNRKLRPSFHTFSDARSAQWQVPLNNDSDASKYFILRAVNSWSGILASLNPSCVMFGSKTWQRGRMVTVLNMRRTSGGARWRRRVGWWLLLILQQKRLLISGKRTSSLTPLPPVSIVGGGVDKTVQSRVVFCVQNVSVGVNGLVLSWWKTALTVWAGFSLSSCWICFKYHYTKEDFAFAGDWQHALELHELDMFSHDHPHRQK